MKSSSPFTRLSRPESAHGSVSLPRRLSALAALLLMLGATFFISLHNVGAATFPVSNLNGSATDQRGVARPVDDPAVANASGGDGTDIGAYEVTIAAGPTLAIVRAGNQTTISWTPNTAGFVLQERTNLALGMWTHSPSGATNSITVPATLPTKFYRLFKP